MKLKINIKHILFSLQFLCTFLALQACQSKLTPKPIKYGVDQCAYCKMTVSDARFGTQLISKKGRVYNFDDVQCMIAYVKEQKIEKDAVAAFYLPDFESKNLVIAEEMFYLKSEALKSPMRGNIAAFSTEADLIKVQGSLGGERISWDDLWK